MKMPRWMATDRVSLQVYRGNTAVGPVYDAPVDQIPARVEIRRKVIQRPDKTEVLSQGIAYILPGQTVTEQSLLTFGGKSYKVIELRPVRNLRELSHYEAELGDG